MKNNKFVLLSVMSLFCVSVKLISSDIPAIVTICSISASSLNKACNGAIEASVRAGLNKDNCFSSRYLHTVSAFKLSHDYSRTGFLMACLAATEPNERIRLEYVSAAGLCTLTGLLGTAYGHDLLIIAKKDEARMN